MPDPALTGSCGCGAVHSLLCEKADTDDFAADIGDRQQPIDGLTDGGDQKKHGKANGCQNEHPPTEDIE